MRNVLLGGEPGEVEDALAPEHVLVIAPLARILDGELDMLVQVPQRHTRTIRQRVAR